MSKGIAYKFCINFTSDLRFLWVHVHCISHNYTRIETHRFIVLLLENQIKFLIWYFKFANKMYNSWRKTWSWILRYLIFITENVSCQMSSRKKSSAKNSFWNNSILQVVLNKHSKLNFSSSKNGIQHFPIGKIFVPHLSFGNFHRIL